MQNNPEIFNLAAECQALSTEQAKQFQTLSRLEVMHHTTARKTINAGQMAHNTAYSILPGDQTHDKKHEETLQQLRGKADQAWKDTNDLVFNHQLCYDGKFMAFISNAERTLQQKQDEVDKLPTIPIDLSFRMPIPMMLAYGPESYAYQTWCEDRGETSSLGKEVRASCLLIRKLKWLAHRGRIDDSSSERSASLAHSACSAEPLPEALFISIPFPVQESLSMAPVKCIPIELCSQCLLTCHPERISPGHWLRERQ